MGTVRPVVCCGIVAVLLAAVAGVGRASAGGPPVALVAVAHAVDGTTLVVTGWLRNAGPRPVRGLVVDVTGFAPDGAPAAFGSDGIPWEVPSGASERFAVRLPLGPVLVREYVVRVGTADGLGVALAEARRSVPLDLYRPLMLARVRVTGQAGPGELVLTADTGALPVALVVAEATVIVVHPTVALLQRLTVALPPNGRRVLALGGRSLFVVDVRVVDLVPASNWDP